MSHPVAEIVAGVAVLLTLGAGTLLVLPQPAPEREAAHETIVLDVDSTETRRAVPVGEKTDAERVEELERQVSALAAEHKELSDHVKAIAHELSRSDGDSQRKSSQ